MEKLAEEIEALAEQAQVKPGSVIRDRNQKVVGMERKEMRKRIFQKLEPGSDRMGECF